MTGTDPHEGSTLIPMTPVRAAVGRRMSESKQRIPHFYLTTEIVADNMLARLERLNAGREPAERVSVTAALIHALSRSLMEHPRLNARWTNAGLEVVPAVNIGVAIALDNGLVAPAVLGCEWLELEQISDRLHDLVARARNGRLRPTELSDGTFSLSNLGTFEIAAFQAIIVPPQVAIIATGAIMAMPRVDHGEVVVRRVFNASLSADHRALDGADGARFLTSLKRSLEVDA